MSRLRRLAKRAAQETRLLARLARDPAAGRATRWIAAATVAYALSPIDLIPDFIPVIGQLDDLVIVPLGYWLVLRLAGPEKVDRLRREIADQD